MALMGRLWLLLASLMASCVSTTSNICSNGSICPGGFVCDVDNDRCLLPEQSTACEGLGEGDECTYSLGTGACHAGACEAYFCGDGVVSLGEDCDGADLAGSDCKSFGYYGVEGLECTASCQFDDDGCKIHEYCGDGVVNGPELCDGPQQRTCIAIGFDAGTASCTSSCTFSISDCSRFGWNPESLSNLSAHAIAGTSKSEQWALGESGRAMHYEGAFWNPVPTNVQNTLVRAWSNATNDTWAVGQSKASGPTLASVVIHWDGTAWSTVSGIPDGEYVDVWGASPTAVYVATDSGAAIHKFDGASWSTLPSFSGTPIAIRGTSASDIYVATSGGPLMHFDGASWTDRTPSGASIEFLDANAANDVWAIGHLSADPGTGVIAHWTGSSWTQWTAAQTVYNAIASSGPNDTWVAGVDGIMRHWDGVAWSRSENIGNASGLTSLTGMISLDAGNVVVVSLQNLAYRYKGQAWGVQPALGSNPFDAPENTALWSASTASTYVTNVEGEVWHFDGTAWELSYTVPGGPIPARDVWGSASNDVWIVDNDGSAHHYNGSTWTPFVISAGVALHRVWTDGTDVWAFGNDAYHKDGDTWTHHTLSGKRVMSVSASSASNIYLVESGNGSPNKLWHWDGASWTTVATDPSMDVLAVAALAPDDVHVTATGRHVLHWDGVAWTTRDVAVLDELTTIAASANDDVIAASERDLAHFNGTDWSAMRTPVDFVPNTAGYLPMTDLFVMPGRVEMLMQKYRLRTLIRTRPLVCRQRETCGDAVDNDCDGLLDTTDASECP